MSEPDSGVPHSARLWNYWLGGTDNLAVDRAVADQILEMVPEMVESARADRAYLGRVVRHLAGELGIRQFLDVGTGIPTANNTHEVAQAIAPSSRVVYVDNDRSCWSTPAPCSPATRTAGPTTSMPTCANRK